MPVDLLKKLLAVRNVDPARTFFAADQLPPDASHPLVRLQLKDDTAASVMALVDLFLDRVAKAVAGGDMVPKEYDPAAYTSEYQVDVLPVSTDAKLSAALAPFTRETDARAFRPATDKLRSFKCVAIAIRATAEAAPIVLFKKQSQPAELRSDRKLRIFSSKGVFDTLDAASFLIDDDFDLAYVGDSLLIFDKEKFHTMFGYYDGLEQFARDAMPNLKASVPMENFADFEAACLADKTLMKRLRRTIGAMPKAFDMARVAKAIVDQSIPVALAGTKKKPLLVFDKTKKHDFFTLLEDGFLKSSYTDRYYEVNSKRTRHIP
jgi:hypothetical protein